MNLHSLLQQADIEGLIALGAPHDEYAQEANDIALALAAAQDTQINASYVAAIISAVWAKSFNLDTQSMQARRPAIEALAERLYQLQSRYIST